MYILKHQPNLTPDRWSTFPTEKQIFMIGNELNRILSNLAAGQSSEVLTDALERTLELTDLTIACQKGSLRFELLRWREAFSSFYSGDRALDKNEIENFLKVLLSLNTKSAILL